METALATIPHRASRVKSRTARDYPLYNPLTVEIGPGSCNTGFTCHSGRVLTQNGTGKENTSIDVIGPAISICPACTPGVQDIRLASAFITVDPGGSGLATWTSVDVEGTGYAWSEYGCRKHFRFLSRIVT